MHLLGDYEALNELRIVHELYSAGEIPYILKHSLWCMGKPHTVKCSHKCHSSSNIQVITIIRRAVVLRQLRVPVKCPYLNYLMMLQGTLLALHTPVVNFWTAVKYALVKYELARVCPVNLFGEEYIFAVSSNSRYRFLRHVVKTLLDNEMADEIVIIPHGEQVYILW